MTLSLPRPTRWRGLLLGLLTACLVGLSLVAPAAADAGRFLESPSSAELRAALEALQPPAGGSLSPAEQQRRDDLLRLQGAIARSDDRAQLRNDSRHSVGVFLRFKKDPPGSPAPFSVLAPGHETDDDFDLVGLYVPADVALSWEPGGVPAAAAPRVARVLEGQRLRLRDAAPDPGAAEAVGYRLDLPLFALLEGPDAAALTAELPGLSQADLDAQPETAPTD